MLRIPARELHIIFQQLKNYVHYRTNNGMSNIQNTQIHLCTTNIGVQNRIVHL